MAIGDIINKVIEVTGVTEEELKSGKRDENIREAKILLYDMARQAGFSLKEISLATGKDRASIIYFLKCIPETSEYKLKADILCDYLGIDNEVEFKPVWGENFKIIDVSSKYFGECYIGTINNNIVSYGCKMKVINEMLDRYERI